MGEDLALAAPATDRAGVVDVTRGWQRPVSAARAAVFRIAFGLGTIVNA